MNNIEILDQDLNKEKKVVFILQKFLDTLEIGSVENNKNKLVEYLKENNLSYKVYNEENLIIIFNNFNSLGKTPLENECRSIVLDLDTCKILNYTFQNPKINIDARKYFLDQVIKENKDFLLKDNLIESYDGTPLSIFYHKKWYISTRRCLNANESIWKSPKSHFELFLDTIKSFNINSFEDFTKELNKDYCYNFVLLHYDNVNIVDYSNIFGKKYKKLLLFIIRDQETHIELSSDKYSDENIISNKLSKVLTSIKKHDDFEFFDKLNNNKIETVPNFEGLIIKIFDKETNKYELSKFQSIDYIFANEFSKDKNIYIGLLKLYQKSSLLQALSTNKLGNYRILEYNNEKYDMFGIVDAVYKICTSELKTLHSIFWENKKSGLNVIHNGVKLYNLLPKEIKDILYLIRGIYFVNKANYIKQINQNNTNSSTIKKSPLTVNDVWTLLKSTDIKKIIGYLRARILLDNGINKKVYPENSAIYSFVNCRKNIKENAGLKLLLTNIYSKLLFPNITDEKYFELNSQE